MDYAGKQARFFGRLQRCSNPSTVKIQLIKITSTGDLTDFTGDSLRSVERELELTCLYQRYLNDKQREKAGVSELVSISIFISPLELEKKYGNFEFPKSVTSSYSGIAIIFDGQHHEIDSIRYLEPIQRLGKTTCIAYQINLRGGKGNTDFN